MTAGPKPEPPRPRVRLTLYVAGSTPHAKRALANVQRLVTTAPDRYELVVCDVLKDPESAEAARIIATPTLVRTHPLPAIRIIGDLADAEELANTLDASDDPRMDGP